MTHRERMVAHFVYLRRFDADYARHALREYLSMQDCPVPDMRELVTQAWASMPIEAQIAPYLEAK